MIFERTGSDSFGSYSEYSTEIQSFARVRSYQQAGIVGAAFWASYGKDGALSFYGLSGTPSVACQKLCDGRIYRNNNGVVEYSQITAWLISKVRARNSLQTTMEFEYSIDQENGEARISKVWYSGADAQPGSLSAYLAFNYNAPAGIGRSNPRVQFASGARATTSGYLSDIGSYNESGEKVRSYSFSYKNRNSSGLASNPFARLERIQECAGNGTSCLAPVMFTWAENLPKVTGAPTQTGQNFDDADDNKYGDINGDGRTDMVFAINDGSNNQKITLGLSTLVNGQVQLARFNTSRKLLRQFDNDRGWHLFDYNQDGRDDLLIAEAQPGMPGQWNIYLSEGSNFRSTPVQLAAPISVPYGNTDWTTDAQIADYTGDGLPDFVSPEFSINGAVTYRLYAMRRATAARSCQTQDVVAGQLLQVAQNCPYEFAPAVPITRPDAVLGGQFFKNDTESYEAVDVNGDGAADMLMRFLASCSLTPQRSAFEAQAPMNFIADPAQRPVAATTEKNKAPANNCWYWGVFENEGLSSNALSMGLKKFWRTQEPNEPADSPGALQLTDINADGLADVIFRTNDGSKKWYFELNTGTGFALSQCMFTNSFGCSGVDNSADTARIMDFDGDGDQDFWVGLEDDATQTNCPGGSDDEQPYAVLRFDGDRFESSFLCPNLVGHKRYRDNSLHYSADIDGDGSIDSIDMSPTGAGNYTVSRRANTFAPVDKVIEIKNGLGSTTLISYAPMNFSSVYRRDYNAASLLQGSSPVFDLLAPQYVVQRVQSSAPTPSNPTSLSSVRYFYAGSKTQGGGRGSLGMRFVGSVDEQTNVQTWTEYAQNFPFIGRPVKTLSKRLDVAPSDSCAAGAGASQCIVRATVCVSAASTPDRSLVCDPFSARVGQTLSESYQSYIHNDIAWGERPQTQVYRVFPHIKLETSYEWNSLTNTSLPVKSSRVREQYWWDGNLYESEATVSALNDTLASEKENVVSRMQYTTLPSLSSDWTTGLLRRSEVTTSRNGKRNTRYASFEYFPDGSVKSEESGPLDAPTDKVLRSHYVRNSASQVILKASCSTHFSYEQCIANDGVKPTFVERVQADQQRIRRAESYVYDSAFRFVEQTYNGFNDGSNFLNYRASSEVLARDALGNATQSRNVNGVISNSAYSPLGKLYFVTTRNSGSAVTTQMRWCANSYGASFGASPVATCPSGAQFVERNDARAGNSSWKYFDLIGREMLTAQYGFIAAGESAATLNSRVIHVSKTYDNLGRVVEVSEPYFATLGSFQSCGIGASGVPCTKTTFDFSGRSLMVTLPDGTFTTTNYETVPECESIGGSCLKRTVINAKLQETIEERNVLGELIRTIDAQNLSIRHSYDVYGNLVRTTRTPSNGDGAGLEIANSAVFDTLSRRVSMTDPDTGTTTSTYNAIGEVLTSVDANGFCIKSTYDAIGRVVSRSDHREATCSGALESTSTFVFDVAANGFGMLAQEFSVSAASNTTRSQQYDNLSRITRLNTSIDGKNFAQESTYDQYGRKFQDFDLVFDAGTPDAISASQTRRLGAEYDYNAQGYQYRIRNAAGVATDIFYEVLKINARGQVERSKRGNNTSMITDVEWDPTMGRLNAIASGSNTGGSNDGGLQNLRYDDASGTGYDEIGNLTYRLDARRNLRESFGYDNMNRLTASSLMRNGQTTGAQSFTYDVLGNFLFKANERQRTGGYSAVSGLAAVSNSCARQSVGPHMLTALFKNGAQDSAFCYDASGNQISATGSTTRSISYSVHNKPLDIAVTGPSSSHTRYRYGPNREIVTRLDGSNVTSLTTVVRYVGGVEVYQRPNQGTETNRREYKRNLAGFLIINLRAHTPSGQSTIVRSSDRRFLFKEKLGSTDVITDAVGSVVVGGTMSFDAWGERRSDSDWSSLSRGQIAGFNSDQTRKGYTGHEMVDGAGLIHMGGRLYDAHTGRFLSADPFIQAPNNTQSFNRYSYVMNNPMNYTDPTGYSWLSDNWRTVAAIAITAFAPYAWAAMGSTLSSLTQAVITGMVSGGVQSGSLKGALIGGFSAGMFNKIGANFEAIAKANGGALSATGVAAKIGVHAVAGGVMSVLQGGKFGHGFISAGVVEAIGPKALAMAGKNEAAQIVAAAVVGGTASRLAGGKFANGAVTGAFQWAFNHLAHGVPPIDSSLEGDTAYVPGYVVDDDTSWMAAAEGELGQSRIAGAGNNERILAYLGTTTLGGLASGTDSTPWCAAFVNWSLSQSGIAGNNSARAADWSSWGSNLTEPAMGAAVVVKWPGTNQRHVAFIAGQTASGRLVILGGNQGATSSVSLS